jgi:sulfite exporter TauE/SafE
MDLVVAFITGVTTGGLSCLAVQGGLLASSLAYQIEHDLQSQSGVTSKNPSSKIRPKIAQPIVLFLIAKLIAYTLLGFLLGALGSILQLTPMMRAILFAAIGIFMIGNGLRMLKVHPIFRYFVFEPPSALTRYIRKKSKNGESFVTPLLLGAMAVFLPCGVTQAMMATAVGTGDPWQGAALMAAFILGTSPVFFTLAYLATRLGSTIEKYFTRIVAVILLVLGLVSIDSGLNLAGSPISIGRIVASLQQPNPVMASADSGTPAAPAASENVILINARDNGYEPSLVHALADARLQLNIATVNTTSCARSIVFPDLGVEKTLPVTGMVTIDVPPQPRGKVMHYSCSMGMYLGQIVFDQ